MTDVGITWWGTILDNSLVAAILGGMIAGGATLWGVILAARQGRKAEREREAQEIASLRKALLVEAETIHEQYMWGIGQRLVDSPEGQPFLFIYPVEQRYFVIYEENAHLIGKIPDAQERKLIVQAVTMAKGLLDSYRFNNSLVQKMEYLTLAPTFLLGADANWAKNALQDIMAKYADKLKEQHDKVVAAFNELRACLSRPIRFE